MIAEKEKREQSITTAKLNLVRYLEEIVDMKYGKHISYFAEKTSDEIEIDVKIGVKVIQKPKENLASKDLEVLKVTLILFYGKSSTICIYANSLLNNQFRMFSLL